MGAGAAQILSFPAIRPIGDRRSCRRYFFTAENSTVNLIGRPQCAVRPAGIQRLLLRRQICRAADAGGPSPSEGHDDDKWNSTLGKVSACIQPVLDFAMANFLPIALLSGISFGLANPSPGCLAHKYSLSKFSTFGIFLISGLMLRDAEIASAKEAWPVGLFGVVSILVFTPLASQLVLKLQLTPQEFVTGLAIFCCMPTTLSSGVALTQLVGGNSALALAMTVISNLMGIMIVPFTLSNFIAAGTGVSVPSRQLFRSLFLRLLLPLILGKGIRSSIGGVAKYVDRNRQLFPMLSAVLLSLVPWIQVSRSRSLLLMVKPTTFLVAIGMAAVIHLAFLLWNTLAIQGLNIAFGNDKLVFAKKENARAVILVASQKTLPVMVAVVEQLGGAMGEAGLLVLPCVAAHINQIIIDSVLVNYWLRKDRINKESKGA
ncbi:probable sodium/metabolite cotransporter BASS4, chloroplastic isoform X2 [Nymphaea colorata]|uniref:probable sodium/metabolite cotransporter BASS4, chloroplastic isoform X2 n=1 Tax=Nymphaea colorata TaxID=210225 RepID=UPI00129D9C59|nr:probable sodium/metabolite cotransporter BASS4, chloroplastic isoform X2 [Nymphaea colorata]